MTTVLIAAHNEEAVIGGTLDGLLTGGSAESLEVIVAANGCTDGTVTVARRRSVEVVEVAAAGKAAALNAAERRATGYPRVYLDADIQLDKAAIERLSESLRPAPGDSGRPLVAVPARTVDVSASSRWVRMYYRVHALHPSYATGLFGRGAVAVSEAGRARFAEFPEVIADDLFLDSLFDETEARHLDDVVSVVVAVRSTRSLVRRLARVRRGNAQLRAADSAGVVRQAVGVRWLTAAVRADPALALATAVYVAVTVVAEARARWGRGHWESERNGGVIEP
ncbi:glycosyltransferase [Flexivirga alba]|uniref:4,4'-diaponeurosporenoate glycosyltransferase n=1 Tax=Flexivirga alba TaxID=702742 RepID=A0ABW2AFV2_9MICO